MQVRGRECLFQIHISCVVREIISNAKVQCGDLVIILCLAQKTRRQNKVSNANGNLTQCHNNTRHLFCAFATFTKEIN